MSWVFRDTIDEMLDVEMDNRIEEEDKEAFRKCQGKIEEALNEYEAWYITFFERR